MKFTHKIAALKRMGTYLLERDVSPARLLSRLALPSYLLLEDQLWVDRRVSFELHLEISRSSGDRCAGLRIADLTQFSDYGAYGAGVIGARTLGEALAFGCREIRQIESGTRLCLREDGSHAHLSVEFLGPVEVNPQQHIEAILLMLRKLLDRTTEHVPATAHFAHEFPRGVDVEPWFGSDLAFGGGRNELVFDRGMLRLPLQAPAVPAGAMIPADQTAHQVMAVVSQMLAYDRPTMEAVAGELHISIRTMQRHLARWGVTFEQLLDEYCHRLALQLLASGTLTITDIAFRLGYSDSAHFTRAFRRWTGKSPRQALKDLATASRSDAGRETA